MMSQLYPKTSRLSVPAFAILLVFFAWLCPQSLTLMMYFNAY